MVFNFNRKRFASGSLPLLTRDVRRARATLDFPSVAAAGVATLTIAVPQAVVGDDVLLAFMVAPTAGIIYTAWVSAADVVSVRANNVTAAPVDPASMDFRVTVLKLY